MKERRNNQPRLPMFEKFLEGFGVKERKPPQPRPELSREPTGNELIYHRFDLRFRGQLNRWLRRIDFLLTEVLEEKEEKMVDLYLWPQEGEWLDQEEVAARMGLPPKKVKVVSFGVRYCLLRIWRREKNGPKAIETLKLPWFLYRGLLEKRIKVVGEILDDPGS